MGKIVPPYGEGALGHLILQVLRDAGEDGLVVTDLIQATKDAGRRYPSAGAERSGVTNVIVGGTAQQKKQAKAIFRCANPEEKFLEQRWALRFDDLDLAGLGETPTEDTYVPARKGGRRKSSDADPGEPTAGGASARPRRQRSTRLVDDDSDFEYGDSDDDGEDGDTAGDDDEDGSSDDDDDAPADPTSPVKPKKRRGGRRARDIDPNSPVPPDDRDEKFPRDFHKEVSGQVLGGDVWVCFLPRGDESGQVDKSFRLFREDTKTRRWFRDVDDKGFHSPGTHAAQLRSIVAVTRYLEREEDREKLSAEDLAAKYSDPKKAAKQPKPSTGTVRSKPLERSKSATTEPSTGKVRSKSLERSKSRSLPTERPAPPPARLPRRLPRRARPSTSSCFVECDGAGPRRRRSRRTRSRRASRAGASRGRNGYPTTPPRRTRSCSCAVLRREPPRPR